MSVFAQPGETHIRKMRVISADRDALSLRLRIAGALSAIDLQPVSLPRSAIVCIHKLSDPLPGALRLKAGSRQAPREWERAVAESVERAVRRAARPALGYVPLNADAVVFLDRAELLACFASDWLEGDAATRWWWQSLFRAADMASVVKAWMEAPEYAPLAFAKLANTGKAAAFVSSLSAGDSRLLLTGIVSRFALRELGSALDAVLNENGASSNTSLATPHPAVSSARAPQRPPWQRWVKETEARELEIGQESLLATGLMLVRAPAAVRSRAFADEVVRWRRASSLTARTGEASQTAKPVNAMKGTAAAHPHASVSNAVSLAVQPPDSRGESGHGADPLTGIAGPSSEAASSRLAETELDRSPFAAEQPPTGAALSRLEHSDRPAETGPTIPLPDQSSKSKLKSEVERSTTQDAGIQPGPTLALQSTDNPAIPRTDPDVRSDYILEAEIETQLGGVFYLINLGLFLNLYGDFTTPAQPGIDLPIWDFVALVGKNLAGDKIRGVHADPIWSLLARLSGRNEDDPPGEEFSAPESWRLPADWLASFEEGQTWRWERSDDRLRVWHPEGFLVVDVPAEADPERQLARETHEYTGIGGLHFSSASSPAEAYGFSKLKRWLRWLMPYIRARLARSLGVSGADGAWRVLLEHQARVVVTATHLDVFFSLEEHPIEIRLAGLDRDAGWVPAAGRYIAFHFE